MTEKPQLCQHEGCTSTDTNLFSYPTLEDQEPLREWLCDDHAVESGFCFGCGFFAAGTEDYDFSPIKGLCGECVDQFREDAGEYDDDDEGGFWRDPYDEAWYDRGSDLDELEPPGTPRQRYIGPGSEYAQADDDAP